MTRKAGKLAFDGGHEVLPRHDSSENGESKKDGVGGVDKSTAVLVLDYPGKEVAEQGLGRKGIMEWVITAKFKKEGPRSVEVRWRKDILEEERKAADAETRKEKL